MSIFGSDGGNGRGRVGVYGKWGDPHAQANRAARVERAMRQAELQDARLASRRAAVDVDPQDPTPHGMSPEHIARMRDRFEHWMPKLAGSAQPHTRAQKFFDGLMPPGANLDPGAGEGLRNALAKHKAMRGGANGMARTAQMWGGGGGLPMGATLPGQPGSFSTMQRPFLPEFESPDRQSYPIHRNLANIYWRLYYKLDPIIGMGVDMLCLPPGEQVVTTEGLANIEDLRIGDELLSVDGDVQWVEGTSSRHYEGEIYTFRAWGCLPFRVTDNHPVFVRPKHKIATAVGGRKRWQPKLDEESTFIKAKDVEVNDFLVLPKPVCQNEEHSFDLAEFLQPGACYSVDQLWDVQDEKVVVKFGGSVGFETKRHIAMSDELAELFGWYVAEGSLTRNNVTFSLNITEESEAQRITDLAMKIFDLPRDAIIWSPTVNNGMRIVICRTAVSGLFALGGVGAENKLVPEFILYGKDSWRRAFLAAYFAGDGTESNSYDVSAGTVSRTLAIQVQLLGLSLGVFFRVNHNDNSEKRRQDPGIKDSYRMIAPRRAVHPKAFGYEHEDTKRAYPQRAVDAGDVWLIPIRVIECEEYDGRVYDIKTSDSAFCMPAIIHNSEMLWSNFELAGDGIQGEIKDALEEMVELTQLRPMLTAMVREFLVIGEAVPHLHFSDDLGIWTHIALHNPDQLEVIHSPFLDMEPLVEFRPDDRLRQILTSSHPMLKHVRDTMPEEILAALTSGQNIPLSPINCTFLARKLHPYDIRGTSIQSRLWRLLLYEDSIFSASFAIARRAAGPLKVAKLGDRTSGYMPDPAQEQKFLELLTAAETDPAAWICYNYAVEFELVGSQERAWKIEQTAEFIERNKLMALGLSKSFVVGETSFACFPSDTPVNVPNGSKAIQDVRVGDIVLDKDGLEQQVEAAWCEGVPPQLVEIDLWGFREPIRTTTAHSWPVWAWPRECACGCGERVKPGKNFVSAQHSTRMGNWRYRTMNLVYVDGETAVGGKPRRIPAGYEPMQKLRADQLQKDDFLLLPRRFNANEGAGATKKMARLLGFYAAEGDLTKGDNADLIGARFSLNWTEYDTLAPEICQLLRECGFGEARRHRYKSRGATTVRVQNKESRPKYEWLHQHAGQYSGEKALSAEVMAWPLTLKRELIIGAFRGDGTQVCRQQKNKRGGYDHQFWVSYTTISEKLALQLRQVLIQLGYFSTIHTGKARTDARGYKHQKTYLLFVYGEQAHRLSEMIWGDASRAPARRMAYRDRYRVDDDYIYVPIRNVRLVPNNVSVYNLTVANTHSYQVNGVATFNSAASGLTVFLQRAKSLREYFESQWLYPKYFRPIAEMNNWVKPTEAELSHRVRTKRSRQELRESKRYILPRVEWDRPLDPSIDSAMIQAVSSLSQLGVRFSKQTLMSLVNRDHEDEMRQLIRETEAEQALLAKHPELGQALGQGGEEGAGGGGGMLGGPGPGGLSPGLPPGGDELPSETGLMPGGGEGPGGAPGGEPAPGGPPPAAAVGDGDEGHGGTAQPQAGQAQYDEYGNYGAWAKTEVDDLRQLLDGESPEDEPWTRMLGDWTDMAGARDPSLRAEGREALHALRDGNVPEAWDAVEHWLFAKSYPPKTIRQLKELLVSHGLLPQAVPAQGTPKKQSAIAVIPRPIPEHRVNGRVGAQARKNPLEVDEATGMDYLAGAGNFRKRR